MNKRVIVGDLKKVIDQYDDKNFMLIRIGLGTTHRIDNCQISPTKHNDELFHVLSTSHDEASGSLILNIEKFTGKK